MLVPKLATTLRTYDAPTAAADVLAGLTVALVALPLSIAIAIASGATPAQGLVTAIVAGFLISALGGSRVQIGGPTGAFIVVVAGVIAGHGYGGLLTATFMAGLILILAALLRAGRLSRFVPEAVVNGFTIGIALIIATSQIRDLLGLEIAHEPADALHRLPALWAARGTVDPRAFLVGALTIVLILWLRRIAPRWPGLIAAVAIGSALAAVLPGVDTVGSRFGALPAALPAPALPDLSPHALVALLPAAVTIAFLAGIESLLSAMVADRMIGGSHRPNAELLSQGVANLASSLFGGLPATGAIARTATNVRAGGRTPVAGMVHALAILVLMMTAAPLAGHLAMPALAGVLMVTAFTMSEPHRWAAHAREPWPERLLLLLTLALTVLVDLTVAIAAGVALGLVIRRFAPGDAPPTLPDGDAPGGG
ncbi:MAG: SulP family inorganic anion transporter [Rhodobacteraceae bacterium]|nr:SulP family inorganic anion transporter [Paracoccaceae bacterium]